jgi:hypothetical protein
MDRYSECVSLIVLLPFTECNAVSCKYFDGKITIHKRSVLISLYALSYCAQRTEGRQIRFK